MKKNVHLKENVYFLALLLADLLGLLSGDLDLTRWIIDGTLYNGGDERFLISSDWFLTTVRRAVKFTNFFLVSCCFWIKISWCLTNCSLISSSDFVKKESGIISLVELDDADEEDDEEEDGGLGSSAFFSGIMLIQFQSPLPILFLPPSKIILIAVDSAELNSGVDDGVSVGVGSAGGIRVCILNQKNRAEIWNIGLLFLNLSVEGLLSWKFS